ncbi:MAG: BamA/TamA family outer membrane protein, partial [Sphingomonadales bacterium]|nr:BamA/TamA family outer membrane protein [Sphingomonadales bacterium]
RLGTPAQCDPIIAGRYLCDAIGKRTTSMLGLSLIYDTLDNRVHPTRGNSASITGEFAGLGGSVKYARLRLNAAKYWPLHKGFIFSLRGEGGIIASLGRKNDPVNGIDAVFLTDRFYLGEPTIRGFDIRGVGPRVVRKYFTDSNGDGVIDGQNYVCFKPADTTAGTASDRIISSQGATCGSGYNLLSPDVVNQARNTWQDDSLGGRYYYLARAELEIPLGAGAKDMGLRPSIFMDAGAVWSVTTPKLESVLIQNTLFFPSRDASGVPTYAQICNGTSTTISSATTPTLPTTCTATGDGVTALGSYYPAFQDFFFGNTMKPRISVGIGVNWNSPFGPFRIDFAKTLLKAKGDDTKSFTFNVGTQF